MSKTIYRVLRLSPMPMTICEIKNEKAAIKKLRAVRKVYPKREYILEKEYIKKYNMQIVDRMYREGWEIHKVKLPDIIWE